MLFFPSYSMMQQYFKAWKDIDFGMKAVKEPSGQKAA